jgi:biopolymer transport protein TolR
MRYLLEVCLIATLAAGITPSALAQSGSIATPVMRKGIHVELPATSNAVSLPDADKLDALIVTITEDGSVYLGIGPVNDPVKPGALAEMVKDVLSNRPDKRLYIKADARTPYANVVKIIDTARLAGVEVLSLLTAQQESPQPGSIVPPIGIEVWSARDCSRAEISLSSIASTRASDRPQ